MTSRIIIVVSCSVLMCRISFWLTRSWAPISLLRVAICLETASTASASASIRISRMETKRWYPVVYPREFIWSLFSASAKVRNSDCRTVISTPSLITKETGSTVMPSGECTKKSALEKMAFSVSEYLDEVSISSTC